MTNPSTRLRLRLATADRHRAIERRLALDRNAWTVGAYRGLLERFWGLYAPLEQRLETIDWRDSGIVFAERRKTGWLERDLIHLGGTVALAGLSTCRDLPPLDGLGAALGALYVLEGSTLGGRVILRALQPQLRVTRDAGARFFGSYGPDVGVMWRGYLAAIETIGASARMADAMERGARDTFTAFDRWFAGAVPAGRPAHV